MSAYNSKFIETNLVFIEDNSEFVKNSFFIGVQPVEKLSNSKLVFLTNQIFGFDFALIEFFAMPIKLTKKSTMNNNDFFISNKITTNYFPTFYFYDNDSNCRCYLICNTFYKAIRMNTFKHYHFVFLFIKNENKNNYQQQLKTTFNNMLGVSKIEIKPIEENKECSQTFYQYL